MGRLRTSSGIRRARSRRVLVGAVALLALVGGGVAAAAWTTSGTGPAAGEAITAQPVTVVAGSPVATLYPRPAAGYPAATPAVGTVYVTLTNPNPYPVRFTTVGYGEVTTTPRSGSSCAAGNVVAADPGPVPLAAPLDLAPGATVTSYALPGALEMVATAPDGCQGATSTVVVTFAGSST